MATKNNINASWKFTKDAVSVAPGTSVLANGSWEQIDLPHTWKAQTDRMVAGLSPWHMLLCKNKEPCRVWRGAERLYGVRGC